MYDTLGRRPFPIFMGLAAPQDVSLEISQDISVIRYKRLLATMQDPARRENQVCTKSITHGGIPGKPPGMVQYSKCKLMNQGSGRHGYSSFPS